MSDEQPFRLILLAGFVIFSLVGICHRLRSRTGERLDRRQAGPFILVASRRIGLAGMGGLAACLINPACMACGPV